MANFKLNLKIMKEIERKFLVNDEFFPKNLEGLYLKQGYLSVDPARIVRIRTEGENAWISIKGAMSGITRPEFEYPIPPGEAEEMMKLALFHPVEKIRRKLIVEGLLWEVDEFLGENRGLWIAEIELKHENQPFFRPVWLGKEVTFEDRFYNSELSKFPFTSWPDKMF
jgi:adenylate cyclase